MLRTRVQKLLPRGQFGRGIVLMTGGTALGQLVVVATTPIITRLYTPDQLGLASTFLALLTILGVAACLRYDITIPLPENEVDGVNLLAAALLITPLVALGLLVVIVLAGNNLVQQLNLPELGNYLLLLPPGILAMGLYQAFAAWTMRLRLFPMVAQTRVNQSIAQTAVQIIAGFMSVGAAGLMLGYIVGQASGIGVLLRAFWRDQRGLWKQVSSAGIWQTIVRYKAFPLFSTLSAIFNSAGLRVTPIVFAVLFGLETAGLYSFADRLTSIPVALVATSLGQAFLVEASRLKHQNPQAVAPLFYRLALRLLLIGCAIGVPLIVFSPWVIGFVFGEKWVEAVIYVQWWGLILIVQIVVSPLSMLNVLEYVRWQFAWDVLRLTLTTGSLFVIHYLQHPAAEAMMFYTIGMVISYGILFVMNLIALRDLDKTKHEQ